MDEEHRVEWWCNIEINKKVLCCPFTVAALLRSKSKSTNPSALAHGLLPYGMQCLGLLAAGPAQRSRPRETRLDLLR
jgi:hypothetical protein